MVIFSIDTVENGSESAFLFWNYVIPLSDKFRKEAPTGDHCIRHLKEKTTRSHSMSLVVFDLLTQLKRIVNVKDKVQRMALDA